MTRTRRRLAPSHRWLAAVVAVAFVVAGCGGSSDSGGSGAGGTGGTGTEDAGPPQPGGRVVYGIDAETAGGWCLPESQLATSGTLVARAVYDTLTAPDAEGNYVPWLADSVEPTADFTSWTIGLRDGVTFHDGSELTAEVVKNNLDAYRGAYPGREALIFAFSFQVVEAVTVMGPLTVRVDLATPVAGFDAYLSFSGRLGIMGQAQLDDPDTCDRELVGTGPFSLAEWVPNDHLTVTRNEAYWATDADGRQLPYLDEIEFRPIVETNQLLNALESGRVDLAHFHESSYTPTLQGLRDEGRIQLVESNEFTEVFHMLMNTSAPPFDNVHARRAVAHAIDREAFHETRGAGIPELAEGPFAPGEPGYLEDTGFPEFDLDAAREEAALYEQETGEELEFTLDYGNREDARLDAELFRELVGEAGITVNLPSGGTEQSQRISDAIAGDFQMLNWRNHAGGGNPDLQYIWWHSGSVANFSRLDDPEVDRLLDEGRAAADPAARAAAYEELNRVFADEVYEIWMSFVTWSIGTSPEVHGVFGPPADGAEPFGGLATGHPLLGLWAES